tara:strand:- start:143 stop:745 length:603 start_codon:yes stop_codon:yes gene_type:complete
MHFVCLDLEGVFIPEIWIAFAEKTGIKELRRTTRDEPDYNVLMRSRLEILDKHNLKLGQIQEVIDTLDPLPGAVEFIDWVQSQTRVVILSDTFEEFAKPLMAKLGNPTLFCHNLEVDSNDRIIDYKLRLTDHKRKAVEAFQGLNFKVCAIGDSYNDLSMLKAADKGIFITPPDSIVEENPEMSVAQNYNQLKELLIKELL